MKLPLPCPFCDEPPSHPQPMAVHPNNDCILNGVVCTWEAWDNRPGEQETRVEGMKAARKLAEDHTWVGVPGGAQAVMDTIDKCIKELEVE